MPKRQHKALYRYGKVALAPYIVGGFDMQLYVEKQLIARRIRLEKTKIHQIQAQAVNRTVNHMKKAMLKLLTQRYAQRMIFFRNWFSVRRAKYDKFPIQGRLSIRGPLYVAGEEYPLKLKKHGFKGGAAGVYIKVKRQEGFKYIARSFQTRYTKKFYQRKGRERMPIMRLHGTTGLMYLAHKMNQGGAQSIQAEAEAFLEEDLQRQLQNKLQKLAHRMAEKHELQRLA